MNKHYKGEIVLLRDNLLKASIVKVLENTTKYLVSFYVKNKFMYRIVEETDIIDEQEYEIIRYRINNINKLLK